MSRIDVYPSQVKVVKKRISFFFLWLEPRTPKPCWTTGLQGIIYASSINQIRGNDGYWEQKIYTMQINTETNQTQKQK